MEPSLATWINSPRRAIVALVTPLLLLVLTFLFFFVLPFGDCLMLGGCERAAAYHYSRGVERYEAPDEHTSATLLRARGELDMAIRARPNFAEAYSYRALVRAAEGNYDVAISDCNKAQELGPDIQLVIENCAEVRRITGAK
jgi:tetratricopeptide (TPR) repeat protein